MNQKPKINPADLPPIDNLDEEIDKMFGFDAQEGADQSLPAQVQGRPGPVERSMMRDAFGRG